MVTLSQVVFESLALITDSHLAFWFIVFYSVHSIGRTSVPPIILDEFTQLKAIARTMALSLHVKRYDYVPLCVK